MMWVRDLDSRERKRRRGRTEECVDSVRVGVRFDKGDGMVLCRRENYVGRSRRVGRTDEGCNVEDLVLFDRVSCEDEHLRAHVSSVSIKVTPNG